MPVSSAPFEQYYMSFTVMFCSELLSTLHVVVHVGLGGYQLVSQLITSTLLTVYTVVVSTSVSVLSSVT